MSNDYVLSWTDNGDSGTAWLRVTEHVAAVFAQALKDNGYTDVKLVGTTVVEKEVTGVPKKEPQTGDNPDTKPKTA